MTTLTLVSTDNQIKKGQKKALRGKESHIKVDRLLFNIFQELKEYSRALLEGVAQVHFPLHQTSSTHHGLKIYNSDL